MKEKTVELIIAISFAIVLIAVSVILTLNAGSISRFWATVGQDKTTSADVIYQTNGVRVYYFKHTDNNCYLADDPKGGAGIFCVKQ